MMISRRAFIALTTLPRSVDGFSQATANSMVPSNSDLLGNPLLIGPNCSEANQTIAKLQERLLELQSDKSPIWFSKEYDIFRQRYNDSYNITNESVKKDYRDYNWEIIGAAGAAVSLLAGFLAEAFPLLVAPATFIVVIGGVGTLVIQTVHDATYPINTGEFLVVSFADRTSFILERTQSKCLKMAGKLLGLVGPIYAAGKAYFAYGNLQKRKDELELFARELERFKNNEGYAKEVVTQGIRDNIELLNILCRPTTPP